MKKPKNKYITFRRNYGQSLEAAKKDAMIDAKYGNDCTVFELVPVVTYSADIKEVKHK